MTHRLHLCYFCEHLNEKLTPKPNSMEELVPTLSRLAPFFNRLTTSRPRAWLPWHQDSNRNMAQLIKKNLNSTTLDRYSEGTSKTVWGQKGHLKALGLLTAPREPGHKISLTCHIPSQSIMHIETVFLQPHILLQKSTPTSFWNDGEQV